MHENITRISHGCSSLFFFFLILTAAAAAPLLHCIHGSFVGPPPQENPVQAASRLIVLGLEVICHAEMLIPGLCTSKYESNLAAFENFKSQFNGHLINKWTRIMTHFNTMVDLVLEPIQYIIPSNILTSKWSSTSPSRFEQCECGGNGQRWVVSFATYDGVVCGKRCVWCVWNTPFYLQNGNVKCWMKFPGGKQRRGSQPLSTSYWSWSNDRWSSVSTTILSVYWAAMLFCRHISHWV